MIYQQHGLCQFHSRLSLFDHVNFEGQAAVLHVNRGWRVAELHVDYGWWVDNLHAKSPSLPAADLLVDHEEIDLAPF